MPLFEVELDGSKSEGGHPSFKESERSGVVTVDAESGDAAKAFAAEQNPGLFVVGAKAVN